MNQVEFDQVTAAFTAFHREFAPLFGRPEAERRSEQYLRGLLVQQTDRRNAENIAETIDGATPRAMQRLLTESPWSVERVIDRLQDVPENVRGIQFVTRVLGVFHGLSLQTEKSRWSARRQSVKGKSLFQLRPKALTD